MLQQGNQRREYFSNNANHARGCIHQKAPKMTPTKTPASKRIHPLFLLGSILMFASIVVSVSVGAVVGIGQGAVALFSAIFINAGGLWLTSGIGDRKQWAFALALLGIAVSAAFWHSFVLQIPADWLGQAFGITTLHNVIASALAGLSMGWASKSELTSTPIKGNGRA